MTGTFDVYTHRPGKGDGVPEDERDFTRINVATVRDRPSVADLLEFLATNVPGLTWQDVRLVGGHVRWQRPATPEELAEQEAHDDAATRRQERYERAAMVRYLRKFRPPDGWSLRALSEVLADGES